MSETTLRKKLALGGEAVRLLSSGKEPVEVLDALVRIGSRGLGELCAIFLVDQGGRGIRPAALYHEDPEIVAGLQRLSESAPRRVGIGSVGRAVEMDKTVIWHEADGPPDLSDRAFVDLVRARSDLVVPIHCGSRVVGALASAWAADYRPTDADVEFAQFIASVAAAAVQNTRLWQELSSRDEWRSSLVSKLMAAQEQERAKLARQLHDDASQLLSTVLLELTRLEQASQDEIQERIQALRMETEKALGRVHDMAVELRPPAIDDIGLAGALRRYVEQCIAASDIKIDFVAANIGPNELSSEAQVSVYRIAQEALLNVIQHSGAQFAGVTLERRKGWLILTIEDDGHGFDRKKYTSGPPKRSLGLFGMRERASLLGGSVHIDSSPGTGTTVTVRIPLESGEQR